MYFEEVIKQMRLNPHLKFKRDAWKADRNKTLLVFREGELYKTIDLGNDQPIYVPFSLEALDISTDDWNIHNEETNN